MGVSFLTQCLIHFVPGFHQCFMNVSFYQRHLFLQALFDCVSFTPYTFHDSIILLKVRKTSAFKLYEAIMTFDDVVPEENMDEVMSLLSETQW